jgi:hypothetical protein
VSAPTPAPATPATREPAFAAAPEPSETPDLAGSWMRYERLRAGGIPAASLDELLGAGTVAPAAVLEIPTLPTRAAPTPLPLAPEAPLVEIAAIAPSAPPEPPAPPLVEIAALLYRGDRALARARELRAEARTADPERLKILIEEVCDLVALAHDAGG